MNLTLPVNLLSETNEANLRAQIRRIMVLHVLGAILFITASVGVTYLLYRLNDQQRWVYHTYEVREKLARLLWNIKCVESSSRGYIASHDKRFIHDVDTQVKTIETTLDSIEELTSDNPNQAATLRNLRDLVKRKVEYNTRAIVPFVESGSFQAAERELRNFTGHSLMEKIEEIAGRMRAEEDNLLMIRQKQVNDAQLYINWAAGVLLCVAFITLLISFKSSRDFFIARALQADIAQKAEENQKKISEQLARSNKDLHQLAYVASHDLQEPLRAVGGFLSLIASRYKDQLGEQGERWIGQAVEGAERMRVLINDLLAFARIESGGGAMKEIDCNEVLTRARKNLEVLLNETGTIIEAHNLPVLTADQAQLVQLFQNLIGNSIKYRSDKTPEITIDVNLKNGEYEFCFADNGMGFDMEHAERIFVIFQRLHSRADHPGTGIGLALCSRIVERHNGKIWTESKPGEGAKFFFTIPKEMKSKELNEIS